MDDLTLKKIVLEVINQLNKTCMDSIFVLSDSFCFKNELENIGYNLNIASSANDINIDNYSAVIIDDLSAEILSCISNLLYKNENVSFIINALLSGKNVIALKNNEKFDSYKNTASSQLFSKLLELENTAKSYGLIILDKSNFLSYFRKDKKINDDKNIVSSGNCFNFQDKKVITKSDIVDIINDYSSIKISSNAIITPLVMDYIKENKINILYE
ncbi:hypothetical protein BFL38_00250 [Brachyspira hampsonii]|uniref:Ethanolamine utilization protein n=1 Tax=Brachyspira hampsonii TaxID=1287055 RepID=A0A1E5NA41_9SPIR|nr:hypothetical protein [Brachyspira hampsonii]OEJ13032.1 hypothetical protein BFL38_00250 [Brachyspira hampsonii]